MAREYQDLKEFMAKKMKSTYNLTLNGDNTTSPTIQSRPILSDQASNVGVMAVGTGSKITSALDVAIEHEIKKGTLDPNMDKKAMRRIISNRYAAKKSHIKKANKMAELEKNRIELENTIATLQPQIENEWQLQLRLRIENEMLAQQLQICTDLKNMKEVQIAEKAVERQWLNGLLNIQVQQQCDTGGTHVLDFVEFDPQ